MKLQDAGNAVLDLLFPRRCPWCDKVTGFAEHDDCAGRLELRRLPPGPVAVAVETSGYLEAAWACYRYKSPVSDAILRLKLKDQPEHAEELGRHLIARYQDEGLAGCFDLIIPVPVSAKTRRRRGYNQSELLAAALAAGTEMSCAPDLLRKVKETRRQMNLTREERRTNILGAYAARSRRYLDGRRILLVDDVLTTGATLNECARTLREAGAVSCSALCLASA